MHHSVGYARSLGFEPHPDYGPAKELLQGIDPSGSQEPVELGRDGKPFFIPGPHDDAPRVLAQLERVVGPSGYSTVADGDGEEDSSTTVEPRDLGAGLF